MGRPQTEETKRRISETKRRQSALTEGHVPESKKCPQCSKYKSASEFNWTKRKLRSGDFRYHLSSWCKECNKERIYKWREENPKAAKEQQNRANKNRKNMLDNHMVDGAKLVAWYEALTEYDKAPVPEKYKRRIRSIRLKQQTKTSAVMIHEVCDAAGYPEVARTLYE